MDSRSTSSCYIMQFMKTFDKVPHRPKLTDGWRANLWMDEWTESGTMDEWMGGCI